MSLRSIVALLSLGAAVTAQTITPTTTSPINLLATSGAVTTNGSFPAGPLTGSVVQVGASGGGTSQATSSLSWSNQATPHQISSAISFVGGAQGPAAGAAKVEANDLVMLLTLPQPTSVFVELRAWLDGGAGMPMPTLRIDVDNDGTFELSGASLAPVTMFLTLGPTALPVRMQVEATVPTLGGMAAGVRFTITPAFTSVTNAIAGCGADLDVKARFDGGVDLFFHHGPNALGVGVVGLDVQPLLLGTSTFFNTPCILLPAPHLTAFVPFPAPLGPSLTLPLPPSLRPLSLWVQNVMLEGGGLVTSEGLRVFAQ